MHLAPHHSATEVGCATSSCCRGGPLTLTGVPNPGIVCWLPRKQMLKAPPTSSFPSPQPTVSKSQFSQVFFVVFCFLPAYPSTTTPPPRDIRLSICPPSLILPAHLSLFVSPHSCTHSENCSSSWYFARGRLAQPHLLCHGKPSVSLHVCFCLCLCS